MKFLNKMLEINFSNKKDKIKISPIGEVTGLDGRKFTINGYEVISNTKKAGIDLVVDVSHGYGEYGEKAAAWISLNSLEQRDDGIYASLELTEIGVELLEKKYFKYLSPAYIMTNNQDRDVYSLDSVGIVNRPNLLQDKLVNTKEKNKKENENMNEEELKKRINELEKSLEEKTKENEKLLEQIKKDKVDNAISSSELLANKKDFALSLNGKQLEDFLELNKNDLAHLQKETNQKQETTGVISKEEIEINKQLGLEGEDK